MKNIRTYLLTAALVITLAASACSSQKESSGELTEGSLTPVSTIETEEQAPQSAPLETEANQQTPASTDATTKEAAFTVDDKRNAVVYVKQTIEEITVYSEPSTDSSVVTTLTSITENEGPRVFLATDVAALNSGWIKVALPIRPNGSQGWIQQEDVQIFDNEYRIEINRANHQLKLLKNGEVEQTHTVAIGVGDTPTPVGTFYTIELLQDPEGATSAYGPFAFGLSGFSETLQNFNGGNGVIGIHGTNDPSSIGKNVSHGCVRLPNDVITAMADEVPLGTPVVIT